ncbi:MAG: autotransporter-associated beta strand repeat-containing protein [Opitutaceae bacterium]
MRHTSNGLSVLIARILLLATGCLSFLQAQTVVVEDFSDPSLPGWTVGNVSGGYTPSVVNNWLRLTTAAAQESTYAVYNTSFASENTSVYADFQFRSYSGTGADGITFFLYDATQTFRAGAFGGSLGYAQKTLAGGGEADIAGMAGGYLAIGIDEYGNYSNPTEGRVGGTGAVPNAIAVRGNEASSYNYLGGTGSQSTALWTNSTTAPTSGVGYGHIILSISPTGQLTVSLARDSTSTPTTILTMDVSSIARPENLRFGFTGSTGGANAVHEISELTIASVPAHLWDNGAGTSTWGTADNWDPAILPLSQSDVLLENTHVSTAQNIDVGTGATRTIRSLYIDAPFNYTLSNGTLQFSGGSSTSTSGIIASSNKGSGATQNTVNSAISMGNNIEIRNTSSGTLSVGGAISNGGYDLKVAGTSDINLGGVISGTGTLTKIGSNTATLGGQNTYTGETKISEGAIKLGASDRISDSSNLNVNGGTLNLNGYSERVGNLTFANGTINYGTTGTTNAFLFNNTYGTPSGVITILNWEDLAGTANDDILATQNGSLSSSILGQFYFSGYGDGASLASTSESLTGYGSGWYRLTPVAATWYTWDGQTSNAWGTATNWNPDGTPVTNANIVFGTTTAGNRNVALGANRSVHAIRFDAGGAGSYNIGNGVNTYSLTMGGTGTAFIQQKSDTYAQTVSAPVVLQSNTVMDMIGSQTLTVSGAVSGSANLIKEGTGGKLLISGNNSTYTGNIYINAGTMQISNANALGDTTGKTIVADGATLELTNNITAPEAIDVAGIGVSGYGAIRNLTGANTISGNITLKNDARLVADASTMTVSGSIGTTANSSLNVAGAGNVTLTGAVNVNAVSKDGSGTLTFSSVNNQFGSLTINAGTVATSANNIIPVAAAVNMTGGTFNLTDRTETIGSLAGTAGAVTLGAGTLTTGGNNGTTTFAGNITSTTGGILTKTGTGTLTLAGAGANTYTGATNINAGAINIQKATGLGAVSGGTTVASGAQLQLQGAIAVGAEALTLSGTGLSSTGALLNVSGNNSYAGAITLNAATRINSDSGTLTLDVASGNGIASASAQNLTFGGAGNVTVNDIIATGAGSLTKDGAGTLTLSAVNTFTGGLNLNAGTVTLNGANRLNSANAVTVNAGTLNLANYNETFSSLSGTGGTVSLGSAALTTGDTTTTSFAGTITGSGGLTKAGTGSMTLSGNNQYYTGAISVSAGTLVAASSNALGTTAGGVVVTSEATLGLQSSIGAEALSLAGTGVGAGGALRNLSGDNSFAGNITLTADTRINSDSGTLTLTASGNTIGSSVLRNLTFGGAGDITVNSSIGTRGGFLTKDGSGTLTLNGAVNNSYTSATTTISQGIVKLGASNVLPNADFSIGGAGELHLQGNSEQVGAMTVANAAGGVIDYGSSAGNNYMVGSSLTFTDTSAVLTISNFVFDDTSTATARDFNLSDVFAVSGTSAPANLANVYFYGYGSADATASGVATNVPVALGGSWYALLPSISTTGWYNWISPTSTLWATGSNWSTGSRPDNQNAKVSFNSGTYQTSVSVGGSSRSLNTLRFNTGASAYTISNGTLRFRGTGLASIQQWSNSTQTIATTVSLERDTVVDISGAGNLAISGALTNSAELRRGGSGSGVMILSGSSTGFSGDITLEGGATLIANTNALGDTSKGTTITDGAELQLQGGIAVGAEALTLRGTGLSNTGALRNISGTNSYAGKLTLTGATRINSDSGTLTLNVASGNGIESASAQNLTFGGAGNVTVSDIIATGGGSLTKDGTGTLTLAAANTFTGAVSVGEGVLNIQNANALGTVAGGVTVSSGAELQLQAGGISFAGESLDLNGTGVSSTGALRNISGNNTWTGAVILDSASRINSDSGTFTISGSISGSGQDLTVGGSGNTTISNVIGTGSGSLTKDGSGTLTLSASNTYTGGTTVNAGTLSTGASERLSNTGALTVNTGGTFNLGGYTETIGSLSGSGGSFTLGAGALTTGGDNSSTTYSGVISGTGGSLTKTGTGTFTLSGANTYSGTTTINQGTLKLGASNVLSDSTAVSIVSGATFDVNNQTETIARLSSTGGTLSIGTGTLTTGDSTAASFNGSITGTGTLISQGTGGLTFTSNINFGGTLVVSSGNTVEFDSGATIANLTLSGGTLKLYGNNTYNFTNLTITGTSTIDFGTGSVTLDVGTLTTNGTALLNVNNWTCMSDYFYATTWVRDSSTWDYTNAPARGQNPLNRVVFNGYTGSNTAWLPFPSNGHGMITPVPEPSTYGAILMGASLSLLGVRRWRKSRKAKS